MQNYLACCHPWNLVDFRYIHCTQFAGFGGFSNLAYPRSW
jgi:hypothetical protein